MVELNATALTNGVDARFDLVDGWVSQCDIRGTLDIIQSCALTLLLSTWSVLCLNVPPPSKAKFRLFKRKLKWALVALLYPEVVTGIAGEQWRAASNVQEDFTKLGHSDWSMTQAFFANMGGFALKCPDFPQFPIDGPQLIYLVKHKYVDITDATKVLINDKNKADGFARAITVVQIVWFMCQCFGRAFQNLGLSTLELAVIANIYGTICSFAFWYHKPLDVEQPIVLQSSSPMSKILIEAQDLASTPYSRTLMGFVKQRRVRPNLSSWWWLGLYKMLGTVEDAPERPVKYINNLHTVPHADYHYWDIIFFLIFPQIFFGIHFIAWNFHFPTIYEAILWKITVSLLVSVSFSHYFLTWVYMFYPEQCGRLVAGKRTKNVFELYEAAPTWLVGFIHWSGTILYCFARGYLIVEGWLGLRTLEARIFVNVKWSSFIPHF